MDEMKNITIYDIAREAGVSPATVSRILTGSANVRTEKKERVEELIRKYQFKPNAMARALTDTRTHFIGMVVADVSNPYYHSLFTACINAASRLGYSLLLFNTLSNSRMEEQAVTYLLEHRVDAMIISGGRIDLAQQDPDFLRLLESTARKTPVVVAGRSPLDMIPGVAADHERSMDLAIRHLVRHGHRKIGFVYTGKQFYGTREKLLRFEADMAEAGLEIRKEWLIEVPGYDMRSGSIGADLMSDMKELPTAMLGINDLVSVGFQKRLAEHGIRVPEDISLLSFDDTYITSMTTPAISSVDYDYDQFADTLVRTAISLSEGGPAVHQVLITPHLNLKESCRRID